MADDESYEGVTVAGLALVAADTGYVLLAQRTLDDTDDEAVRETWEFPGGHLNEGEEPMAAAVREFAEEMGFTPPEGLEAVGGWRSEDGTYQGFIIKIPYEINLARWTPTEEVQDARWFNLDDIVALGDKLRPEVREQMDWELIFGTEALAASGWGAPSGTILDVVREKFEGTQLADDEREDDYEGTVASEEDIPVVADGEILFHGTIVVHDIVAAGRPVYPSGGTLRYAEGDLPVTFTGLHGETAAGVITRTEERDGRIDYEGHFTDGDGAEDVIELLADFGRLAVEPVIDDLRDVMVDEDSMTSIHNDARVTGARVTIDGGFEDTYLAMGPLDEEEPLSAAGRGPGWATHPRETSRLHRYWTKGPGAAKIRWNTPGDFYRCRRLVGAKIAANSPDKLRFINRICAVWHHDATGLWTGDRRNPGNAIKAAADVEPLTAALSAAGVGALPAEWFTDTGISEMTFTYDEATGFTRVSGMIAENRRCHIGYGDRCVRPPKGDGKYRLFRKGTITTDKGELPVGALVYQTGHAAHKISLQEAAAHYDNTGRAWAFVNVGNNRQGIWFSGVVNPELGEQAIWAIKAGGAVSGDWRGYEGRHEMIAAVSVNVPGYPQPLVAAAFGEDGELLSVTAAGIVLPTREERIDGLRASADSILREAKIEALRASAHHGLRESRLDRLRAAAREAL